MAAVVDLVTFDCADAQGLAAFWAAALGYGVRTDKGHWVVIGPERGAGPGLGFQRVPEGKVVKNRVHLDLQPAEGGSMEAEVARLEGLGARRQRLVRNPDGEHVVMLDPEGNEFCVVPS